MSVLHRHHDYLCYCNTTLQHVTDELFYSFITKEEEVNLQQLTRPHVGGLSPVVPFHSLGFMSANDDAFNQNLCLDPVIAT